MSTPAQPLSQLLDVFVKEGKRRILFLTSLLSIVALTALALGIILPKRYDAQALLVVETGTAAKLVDKTGGDSPNQQIAQISSVTMQVTDGRRIQRELLQFGGWVQPPPAKQPDPQTEAQMLMKLRSRIKIDTSKDNFVKISYNDTDADRAYQIVNKLGEIFIRECDDSQIREAKEALDFIENQVKEYGDKLAADHQQVLSRHQGLENTLAGTAPTPPGSGSAATPAPSPAPRPAGALGPDEIAQLKTEKATLEAQLAKKSGGAAIDPQAENAARARVASLQGELDRLRAGFTEEHPDVKRVKRELGAAKEELAQLEASRRAKERDERNAEALDEEVRAAARSRLEAINKRLAMAGVAVAPSPTAPRGAAPTLPEQKPEELRGIGSDTTLAELVRRYEATREVYQDLLKRRESARVTLELVQQHKGFVVRVQEPAERPTAATGLRLSHFCMMGLVLAVLLPGAILFAIVKLDRRVRTAHQIEAVARVPLLVSISPGTPASSGAGSAAAYQQRNQRVAIAMVAAVLVIYVATFVVKTMKA